MIYAAYGLELERARRDVNGLIGITPLCIDPDIAMRMQRVERQCYNDLADALAAWGPLPDRYNYRYRLAG